MSASIYFSKDHATSAALLVIIYVFSLCLHQFGQTADCKFCPKIKLFDGEECVSDSKIVAECSGNFRSNVDAIIA